MSNYSDESYTEAVDSGAYSSHDFEYDATGYGLAQWTYHTRKKGLYNYAKSCNVSIADENMQIEYLLGEISESGGADGYATCQLYARKGYTISDWKNASTPEEAASAFCWIFENPGIPHEDRRKTSAREYYEKYKDSEEGGVFIKDSKDNRIIGTFTSAITGRTFTIYNQNRIVGWGARCNRAAQISVCSGYWDGKALDLISKANAAPDLTMPRYTKMYDEVNLRYSEKSIANYTFDENKIREQIQSGGYVVLYVAGSKQGKSGVSKYGTKWASSAHWVAILGYRILDGKEEIFVSDSGHNETGWTHLDEFDGITERVLFIDEKG